MALKFRPKTLLNHLSIALALLLLSGRLQAQFVLKLPVIQNQTLRLVAGGWDWNANGRPEILAIQEPLDTIARPEVLYYEETVSDTLSVLWRYTPEEKDPLILTDANLADIDGDGYPEIAVLLYFQTLLDGAKTEWLKIFEWDQDAGRFAATPTFSWDYRGRGISYLRPRQLKVADLDQDGNDELVISTRTPDRMILLAELRSSALQVLKELRPPEIATGSRPLGIVTTDFNGDTRPDILVIRRGPGSPLLAFLNGHDDFHQINVPKTDLGEVLTASVAAGDLNNNGQGEVILPHVNGALTLVSMTGPDITALDLDTRIEDLLHLMIADLDDDGREEILYLHQDGTITSNDLQLVIPFTEVLPDLALPANFLPPFHFSSFIFLGTRQGSDPRVAMPVHSAGIPAVLFATIGQPVVRQIALSPLPTALPAEPMDTSRAGLAELEAQAKETARAQEPLPRTVREVETEVYYPERFPVPDPRALPPHRTPDIVLYVGTEFARNIIGDRVDEFAGFRFLRKPDNMVFNFQRQSIIWQPGSEQLGAWNVEYEITYHIGVRPEDMVTDSVLLPAADIVREQILIYVNDPPHITSEPENLRLLAGDLFAYRIQVDDKNSDARLHYQLDSGPAGMSIDRDGIVTWRTNESHHDDYQIVLSVSDGFDKDLQTFTLNVNAQLTITSQVPQLAMIDQPYQYQLTLFQPGTPKEHFFSLASAPEGMMIDANGLITWTPNPQQIDTQYFEVRVSDGAVEDVQHGAIYVNAPPEIVTAPSLSVVADVGDTLHLSFSGSDRNAADVLTWTVTDGPLDMTIDPSGVLNWPITYQDLDANRYEITLSDGMNTAVFRGVVFVNSPITITSAPPDSATVGQPYKYVISTRDDNRGTLLKFRRPTVIPDITGVSAYRVSILDDRYRESLPRYLARFRELNNIYINKPRRPPEGELVESARIDLKLCVKHLFIEDDQLIMVIKNPEQGFIEPEDVLWELFQGAQGIMPKYEMEPVPLVYYSLLDFPDGMTVSYDGIVTWTPRPAQAGIQRVRLLVSDGYTRDEQTFQIYANYPPAIVSLPDTLAVVEQRYTYQVRVDDKNEDAELNYRLVKHPDGMQVDSRGLVTWIPSLEQLNWQEFTLEVTDGHATDRQSTTVFVNMLPRVISQPKPVALNDFEYTYRVVAEDLNRDEIRYRALKLPRYSEFDARTGLFRWKPRSMQKGPNDVAFEITDTHGGVTIHEFQVHVFEDPSRRQFLFTGWPLLMAFAGLIFILGLTLGGA